MSECKVIGLTGGVGSGKTFIAVYAHDKYGVPIILADEVGHLALRPSNKTYAMVVETFGEDVLATDGTIDRKKLGNLVFSDALKLETLNHIVHPFIEAYIKDKIAQLKAEAKTKYILLEAAILLESNLVSLCDEIWFVKAGEAIRRERLKSSRGYTDQKIDDIIKAQLSEEEMERCVDQIIVNNGNLQEIDKQLEILLV